ncbi:acyl-CoA desaturase [Fimbriiglobus ruber]|uniref:Fatty acid desaturase n=1 Tax=Fimbriiglobus ruber TaxID=1908690 RepID=A0A225DJA8_9BACT|nr:fatty acid desaturase [Fimbriiglobus ruber]OWK38678.1 Fatty acid desaturase [Fimbriiglobus ruber]
MIQSAVAVQPVVRPKILPVYVGVLIAFHALVPLAFVPYFFTWWGIPILLIGNAVFGSIGINLGYHRLLTHRSLQVPGWLEKIFVVCGICSLEGPPLKWVATHRMHHQTSDEEGDPHSPVDHFYWGHMGWIYTEDKRFKGFGPYEKYVPDLLTDRFMRWLHKKNRWAKIYLAHLAAILVGAFVIGWAVTGELEDAVQITAQAFAWGIVVRTVYVWHITWLVNSASHRWGYRNYETSDRSRNNWVVAALTNGEGWHNNHHAAPRSAAHGHRWWEIDLTYTFIRMLEVVGLAKQVVPIKVAGYKSKDAEKAA